jgi:hypothetical protein
MLVSDVLLPRLLKVSGLWSNEVPLTLSTTSEKSICHYTPRILKLCFNCMDADIFGLFIKLWRYYFFLPTLKTISLSRAAHPVLCI